MLAIVAATFATAARAQTSPYLNSYTLLLPFLDLLNNPDVTASNLQQAISINNNSTAAQRNQAITDNTMSVENAGIVADGLGTRQHYPVVSAGGHPRAGDRRVRQELLHGRHHRRHRRAYRRLAAVPGGA